MRTAQIGREICTSREGNIVAINFGYGMFCEHDSTSGLTSIVNKLYNSQISISNVMDKRELSKVQKDVLNAQKVISKQWKRNPGITSHIVYPGAYYCKRHVIVDNTEHPNKPCVLRDGNYIMMMFHNRDTVERYVKSLDGKRKFSEERFIGNDAFMDDPKPFAAAWADGDGFILMLRELTICENIADMIETSLKKSSLAIYDGFQGVTRNRGLTLVFLDRIGVGHG